MILLLILGLLTGFAAAPSWWQSRGVLDASQTTNDYAAANVGQLKNIAKKARDEVNASLPGGAGTTVEALINSFSATTADRNDFAGVNVGQLKAVAKPFYDRLIQAGFTTDYPWSNTDPTRNDYAQANIGQVKNLFKFDLTLDSNANGLPDWWKIKTFGSLGAATGTQDTDGDGVSNKQEYLNGTDPKDYYNGVLPTLQIFSGGNQWGAPNSVLPVPLAVKVNANGSLNAPVTINVTAGGAMLSLDGITGWSANVLTRSTFHDTTTNTDLALVYVKLPSTIGNISNIIISSSSGGQSVNVTTTAGVFQPNLAPPSNVVINRITATSLHVTWLPADLTKGTRLELSSDGGRTWSVGGAFLAGVTQADLGGVDADATALVRASALDNGTTTQGAGAISNPLPPQVPPILTGNQAPYLASVDRNLEYIYTENAQYNTLKTSVSWGSTPNTQSSVPGYITYSTLPGQMPAFPAAPPSLTDVNRSNQLTTGFTSTGIFNASSPINYYANLTQSRFWLVLDNPAQSDVSRMVVIHTARVSDHVSSSEDSVLSLTIPSGQTHSPPVDLLASFHNNFTNARDYQHNEQVTMTLTLLPVEVAPDVLAVNSNFDEGRVDSATHFAIPDCDELTHSLKADRDHLDGKWKKGDLVTEDLHNGFFGLRPGVLPYSTTAGATVKIKKLDKVDPDTQHKESGQVRLYAVWGPTWSVSVLPIELYDQTTLAANDIGPLLYNQDPNVAVDFYIEGVRPGKITLEFSYQKGSTSFKHEQEFLVATQKSAEEWKEEARYQIRLQTYALSPLLEVDISKLNPADGFGNPILNPNSKYLAQFYYYYAQFFKQHPEKQMWAGMAKVAGAEIYAGMNDMDIWAGYSNDAGSTQFLCDFLVTGARAIFTDMGWSHRAYEASGIWALKYVRDTALPSNNDVDFAAWRAVDDGIANNDDAKIREGAKQLLNREQAVIMQPYYSAIAPVKLKPPSVGGWQAPITWLGGVAVPLDTDGKAEIGEWISANSVQNPIPGGPALRTVVPGGRLDHFNDRWTWIIDPALGMLQLWTGQSTAGPNYNAASRLQNVNLGLRDAAYPYSHVPLDMLPYW